MARVGIKTHRFLSSNNFRSASHLTMMVAPPLLFVFFLASVLPWRRTESFHHQYDLRLVKRRRIHSYYFQRVPPTPIRLYLEFPKLLSLPDYFGRSADDKTTNVSVVDIMVERLDDMEKEVYASARLKMDQQQLERALLEEKRQDSALTSTSAMDPQKTALMASQWQISLAAASAVSTFVLVSTNASIPIAGIVFVLVFAVANGDPLEEENATGAVARQVGRLTIQSVESSKPKLKAIARAALTDQEELMLLKKQVWELQEENIALKLWQERRISVDDNLSRYSLDELKDIARSKRMAVGGSKSQLMMRLLEGGVQLDL